MTLKANRIVRSVAPISIFPDCLKLVSSAVSWNQGDLLYLDTATHLIKPVASDANCQTYVGIAQQTVINGKPAPVYSGTAVDAAQAIESLAGPVACVVAKLKLKVGDSFVPGGPVYYGGDAQTVSSSGTYKIGLFQDAAITAVSGSEGNIYLVESAQGQQ